MYGIEIVITNKKITLVYCFKVTQPSATQNKVRSSSEPSVTFSRNTP